MQYYMSREKSVPIQQVMWKIHIIHMHYCK